MQTQIQGWKAAIDKCASWTRCADESECLLNANDTSSVSSSLGYGLQLWALQQTLDWYLQVVSGCWWAAQD